MMENYMEVLRSADEWLAQPEYEHKKILDPDGWDRRNFAESWNEKITRAEFERRLNECTVLITKFV